VRFSAEMMAMAKEAVQCDDNVDNFEYGKAAIWN
jgi:hypothetical protein